MNDTASAELVTGRDAWDRLGWLWTALFAFTLGVPTAVACLDETLSSQDRLAVVAVAAALAVLHWLVIVRHPEWWERRLGPLAVYWAVASGLAVVLAALQPSFMILLYGLYPLMFLTLAWWGMVPLVGLTAMMGWALGGWGSGSALVTNLLATAGLAGLIGAFITTIGRQSEQRRDALAALAATRAELAAAARRSGMQAERERLARELHDTVAQGFISVVTQLESAEQALDDDRPIEARERLGRARQTARESLREVRATVLDLRPDLLAGGSVTEAVQRAAERWSTAAGVPVQVRVTGDPVTLHPDTELALLRTTQEALANVARHASATRVIVSVSYLGDTVTLDVDDDGVGFSPTDSHPVPHTEVHPEGGFGLIGIRERVQAAGGELSVESTPGHGTTIAVSVPT
jgi:signal transduction histidine kinase